MSNNASAAIETTAATLASKATMYTGGGASVVAWWQGVDWLAVIGAIAAIAGFILNFYFQYKKHQREHTEALLRMQREQEIHEMEMKKRRGEE